MPRCFRPAALAALALAVVPAKAAVAQTCTDPNFKVELLAAVPEIEHPSVVTCDDEGNLFVGEDPMDMRGPTTEEFDRILRITFNPDGTIARKTVFAEGLSAVFGLIWHDGSLYAMHAPHYSKFTDTDGDGVADERVDLADGFGPPAGIYGFNDHIVTGTRLGLDGYVYVSVGDKGVQRATGSDGSSITLEGGGVVRMRLDGTGLELFSVGTRNHLDVAMDRYDNIFTYDNTDDGLGWWTRFTHHVPTGYYGYPYDYHDHPERHLPRISEHGGGSPVGAACYRGGVWPEEYREAAFHCEWGKGKVQVFFPKRTGATFDATMRDFLVGESGGVFRPQDLCFSPDGRSMYVADWNFGGWTQPLPAGRLYRVTYVGPDVSAPAADGFASPSHHERMSTQWAMAREGREAIGPVEAVLADDDASTVEKVHAIWTMNALIDSVGKYDPTARWVAALDDGAPEVRAQAARALGLRHAASVWSTFSTTESERRAVDEARRLPSYPPAAERLARAVAEDDDARVRLRAAVALGRIGDRSVAESLMKDLDEPDAFARFAIVQAIRAIGDWSASPLLVAGDDEKVVSGLILAATGVYDEGAVATLAKAAASAPTSALRALAVAGLAEVPRRGDRYEKGWWGTRPAAGPPPRPKVHPWEGTDAVLGALRGALDAGAPAVRVEAVRAVAAIKDEEALPRLRTLIGEDPDEAVRLEALGAIARAKDGGALPSLVALIRDEDASEAVRGRAIETVQAIGSSDAAEALAGLVAAEDTAAPLIARGLDALAALEARAARPVAEARLADPDPAVRARAVAAVAVLAGAEGIPALLPALGDEADEVRVAALRALAGLDAEEAVPTILPLAYDGDAGLRGEAIRALARIGDRRATAVYLGGLTAPDPTVREAVAGALLAFRGEIVDDLRARSDRGELSTETRQALAQLFAEPAPIARWQLLGSWPQDEPAPAIDPATEPDLDATVTVGDRELRWREITTEDPNGRVDPARHVRRRQNVWALAYAPITASREHTVTWRIGSDDQAILWVNGERVYEFLDNRGWSPDQAHGEVTLHPGINHVYLRTGNSGGGWNYSLAIGGLDPGLEFLREGTAPAPDLDAFARYAAEHAGDPARGAEVFFDPNGVGCVRCHSVGDRGTAQIGPNLLGVGAKYPRDELIRSVLMPSDRIASGYEISVIATVDGRVLQGIVTAEDEESITLADSNAELTVLPKADVDERRKGDVSAMPAGLQQGLKPEDFADVIAYLESQKDQPAAP